MAKQKRPITHHDKLFSELEAATSSLVGQSPYECALIGAGVVENALVTLLHNFFILDKTIQHPIDVFDGGLGSLNAKNVIAYRVGLISKKTHNNIDLITKIRNTFAHSFRPIDFTVPQISVQCKYLRFPRTKNLSDGRISNGMNDDTDPRGRFISAVSYSFITILESARRAEHRPPVRDF